MDLKTTQSKIRNASLIMMGSIFLSRIIGFFREWVLAKVVGASTLTDVYYASFTIPDFINHLMAASALSISFIPMLHQFHESGRDHFGKLVFRSLTTYIGGILIFLIVLAEIFAPTLSYWISPGFSSEQQKLLTLLIRIILPAQFFFYWGALAISVQYTYGRFFIPALAPIVYNLGIISLGVFLHEEYGIMGFSIGVMAGVIISHGFLQWVGIRELKFSIKPYFKLDKEILQNLKRYVVLTLPIMVSFSIVIADEWIMKYFASYEAKWVSLLSYARTEMKIPIAMIGGAMGVASFPFLSKLWAQKKYDEFSKTIFGEIKKLGILSFCATLLFWIHAEPITHFIYGGGKLSILEIRWISQALKILSLGVFFGAAQMLLSRGFYAAQKTYLPSVIGTIICIAIIPMYAWVAKNYEILAITWVSTLGIVSYTVILSLFLYFHLKKVVSFSFSVSKLLKDGFGIFLVFLVCKGSLYLNLYKETQLTALLDVLVSSGLVLGVILFYFKMFVKEA